MPKAILRNMRIVRRDSDGYLWPWDKVTAAKKGFTSGRLDENGKFISDGYAPAPVTLRPSRPPDEPETPGIPPAPSAPEVPETNSQTQDEPENSREDTNDEDSSDDDDEDVYDD